MLRQTRAFISACGRPGVLGLLLVGLAGGCGFGGTRVRPPAINPGKAAKAALGQLDANADEMLSEKEVEACPALHAARAEYDTNGDQQIVEEELVERFKAMYEGEVGLISADCSVSLNRKPLPGATVRFIPETFLGDATKAAAGTTDESGFAQIAIPDDQLPERLRGFRKMQVGLYRVEITHPQISLPAKYNTQSTLGYELNPANHDGPHAKFQLEVK